MASIIGVRRLKCVAQTFWQFFSSLLSNQFFPTHIWPNRFELYSLSFIYYSQRFDGIWLKRQNRMKCQVTGNSYSETIEFVMKICKKKTNKMISNDGKPILLGKGNFEEISEYFAISDLEHWENGFKNQNSITKLYTIHWHLRNRWTQNQNGYHIFNRVVQQ